MSLAHDDGWEEPPEQKKVSDGGEHKEGNPSLIRGILMPDR